MTKHDGHAAVTDIRAGALGPANVDCRDAKAILGLMLGVWERRADARLWRRHLLERLCALLDAKVGITANTRHMASNGRSRLDMLVDVGWETAAQRALFMGRLRAGPLEEPLAASMLKVDGRALGLGLTVRREEVMPDDEWYGHADVQTVYKAADVNHTICWMYFGPRVGMTISVRLLRAWRESQPFTRRETALLDLAGSYLPRLYLEELEESEEGELSPRARQTLALLLKGHGEKEIAELLDLSTHTVHDYIKTIYRHYRVRTRSALLARFIE